MSTGEELYHACENGRKEEAQRLIREGADVEWRNEDITPLIAAASYGHVDVVRLLLDHGADIHNKSNGFTALHWAACNGKDEAVRLLIQRGADLHIMNDGGCTPLDIAKGFNKSSTAAIIKEAINSVKGKYTTIANPTIHKFHNKFISNMMSPSNFLIFTRVLYLKKNTSTFNHSYLHLI